MRSRATVGDESEQQTTARARISSNETHHQQNVLDLQRQIGNEAVARMLTPVVQRVTPTGTPAPEETDQFGQVISGHGRFNEEHLAPHPTARRKKAGTFIVPENMTVVMYAPAGAYLNNDVANRIEQGSPPAATELELKHTDAAKTKPLPPGYPYTFTAGQEVIDYTVHPPDGLTLQGSPKIVDKPTPLRTLVAEAAEEGHTNVHYACCSSGYSEKRDFESLFPERGFYVRFK